MGDALAFAEQSRRSVLRAAWFSTFFENALVSRVKRRMCIRIVRWSAPDVERMRRSYIALTEVMARMPLVLHETRGQPLLAPRSFSREQWSRL
jgi:hypothetical protein